MVVDVQKLKGKLVENSYTQETMAVALGMHPTTFKRKLAAGGIGFSVGDVEKMARLLHLQGSDTLGIFFTNIVA